MEASVERASEALSPFDDEPGSALPRRSSVAASPDAARSTCRESQPVLTSARRPSTLPAPPVELVPKSSVGRSDGAEASASRRSSWSVDARQTREGLAQRRSQREALARVIAMAKPRAPIRSRSTRRSLIRRRSQLDIL
jgi:hypothetical protein